MGPRASGKGRVLIYIFLYIVMLPVPAQQKPYWSSKRLNSITSQSNSSETCTEPAICVQMQSIHPIGCAPQDWLPKFMHGQVTTVITLEEWWLQEDIWTKTAAVGISLGDFVFKINARHENIDNTARTQPAIQLASTCIKGRTPNLGTAVSSKLNRLNCGFHKICYKCLFRVPSLIYDWAYIRSRQSNVCWTDQSILSCSTTCDRMGWESFVYMGNIAFVFHYIAGWQASGTQACFVLGYLSAGRADVPLNMKCSRPCVISFVWMFKSKQAVPIGITPWVRHTVRHCSSFAWWLDFVV